MYFNEFSSEKLVESIGHRSCQLLGPAEGCVGECAAGISIYSSAEYAPSQVHPYQEGFYVISGEGYAKIARNEFPIHAGTSFLVPSGTEHTLRSSNNDPVKVFWFHSA